MSLEQAPIQCRGPLHQGPCGVTPDSEALFNLQGKDSCGRKYADRFFGPIAIAIDSLPMGLSIAIDRSGTFFDPFFEV